MDQLLGLIFQSSEGGNMKSISTMIEILREITLKVLAVPIFRQVK